MLLTHSFKIYLSVFKTSTVIGVLGEKLVTTQYNHQLLKLFSTCMLVIKQPLDYMTFVSWYYSLCCSVIHHVHALFSLVAAVGYEYTRLRHTSFSGLRLSLVDSRKSFSI